MNNERSSRGGPTGYIPVSTADPETNPTPNNPNPSDQTLSFLAKIDWKSCVEITCLLIILLLFVYSGIQTFIHRNNRALQHEFVVDTAKASPMSFNTSNGKITTGWNIVFNVTNISNSSSFYYDEAKVSIMYHEEILWIANTPTFFLVAGERKSVKATLETTTTVTADEYVPLNILRSQKMNLPVYFNLVVDGAVRDRTGNTHEKKYSIMVICPFVKMGFQSSREATTTLSGGTAKCVVWT